MSVFEPVTVQLTDDERRLLRWGLIEWGGPARCTEEMAIALGFKSVAHLLDDGHRIADDIGAGRALPPVDWARALLATEVAFASDVLGSGRDWEITVGLDDAQSIRDRAGRHVGPRAVHGRWASLPALDGPPSTPSHRTPRPASRGTTPGLDVPTRATS